VSDDETPEDDDLRALIVARQLGVLDEEEAARVERALSADPQLAKLESAASAALGDPEPGPLEAPEGAWEGIAKRISRARAEALVQEAVPISLRCTYCHDQLPRIEAAYCASCLAPHHGICFREHGRCSAPGCDETQIVSPQAAPAASPARPSWRRRSLLVVASACGLAAAAAVGWSLRGEDPGALSAPAPGLEESEAVDPPPPAQDADELLRNARRLLRSAREHVVLSRGGEAGAQAEAQREVAQSLELIETAEGRLLSGLLRMDSDPKTARSDLERALELDPQLTWAHLGLGLVHLGGSDYVLAVQHYQQAIQADPEQSRGAHLGLARALLGLGRREEAHRALEIAAEREPGAPLPRILLGELAFQQGRLDEAELCFTQALQRDPSRADAYSARAQVRVATGQLEEATADLNRAVELDPQWGDTWVQLAALHLAVGHAEEALEAARRGLELGPQTALGCLQLTKVCEDLEQPELAKAARRALQTLPPPGTVKASALARLLAEAGPQPVACGTCGLQVVPSEHQLTVAGDRVVDFCSRDHMQRYLDGERFDPQSPNRAEGVVAGVEEALRIGEDGATALLSSLDRTLALDPEHARARVLRAKLLRGLGRYEEAERDLQRALELSDDGALRASALIQLGEVRVRRKRYGEAQAALVEVLELQPQSARAHYLYAKTLHHDPEREGGDWARAEEEYSKAIAIDPTLGDAFFHRGALHVDRSRGGASPPEWQDGLDDLQRAEELQTAGHPCDFEPYYLDLMRGVAYFGMEDWKLAREYLVRFMEEASPGEENYATAKAMLRELDERDPPRKR